MALKSLRRYLTSAELQEYQPSIITVDNNVLIKAEQDIDTAIANFYQGNFSKAFKNNAIYQECIINGLTCTITGLNTVDGYLSKTVFEIQSGANSGKRFFITSQIGNVLTFAETTGLTETIIGKVYQYAKAPFYKDRLNRSIDERVKEAVAYQYVFRVENAKKLNNTHVTNNYSVNKSSLSQSFDTKERATIFDRISPQAFDVIEFLTVQSL